MNYILRSGKYKGKKWTDVQTYDRGYIEWVRENRPEMLRPLKKKAVNSQPINNKFKFIPLSNYDIDKTEIEPMKKTNKISKLATPVHTPPHNS